MLIVQLICYKKYGNNCGSSSIFVFLLVVLQLKSLCTCWKKETVGVVVALYFVDTTFRVTWSFFKATWTGWTSVWTNVSLKWPLPCFLAPQIQEDCFQISMQKEHTHMFLVKMIFLVKRFAGSFFSAVVMSKLPKDRSKIIVKTSSAELERKVQEKKTKKKNQHNVSNYCKELLASLPLKENIFQSQCVFFVFWLTTNH